MTAMLEMPRLPFTFATVGTDHHPFDRLVDWVDSWTTDGEGRHALVQSGTSRLPTNAAGYDYLPHPSMTEAFGAAHVVVSHGGTATVLEARRIGRLPIVVPRRPELGEHVDDHQVRFAKRLADRGQLVLVEDEAALRSHLDHALVDPMKYRLERDEENARMAAHRFEVLVTELMAERNI